MNILVKICTLFVTHFWTFLAAFGMTVRVTVLALIFATIIGIVVALMRLVGPKPLKAVGNVYISIIRGEAMHRSDLDGDALLLAAQKKYQQKKAYNMEEAE